MNHTAQMKDEIHLTPSSYSHKTFSRLQKAAPGQQPDKLLVFLSMNLYKGRWSGYCQTRTVFLSNELVRQMTPCYFLLQWYSRGHTLESSSIFSVIHSVIFSTAWVVQSLELWWIVSLFNVSSAVCMLEWCYINFSFMNFSFVSFY